MNEEEEEFLPSEESGAHFLLPDGWSAILISKDGTEFAVRSDLCQACGGAECGIPVSLKIAGTICSLLETSKAFREYIYKTYKMIAGGGYAVPPSPRMRKDLH